MVSVKKHLYAHAATIIGMLMGRNARLVVSIARLAPIQSVTALLEHVKLSVTRVGLVNDVILTVMLLTVKPVRRTIQTYASNAMINFIVKRIPLVSLVPKIV